MSGFLLVITLTTVFDDPLLPEKWRKAALGLSRDQQVLEIQDPPSPEQQLGELRALVEQERPNVQARFGRTHLKA